MEAFRASMQQQASGSATGQSGSQKKKVKVVPSRFMQGITKKVVEANAAPSQSTTTHSATSSRRAAPTTGITPTTYSNHASPRPSTTSSTTHVTPSAASSSAHFQPSSVFPSQPLPPQPVNAFTTPHHANTSSAFGTTPAMTLADLESVDGDQNGNDDANHVDQATFDAFRGAGSGLDFSSNQTPAKTAGVISTTTKSSSATRPQSSVSHAASLTTAGAAQRPSTGTKPVVKSSTGGDAFNPSHSGTFRKNPFLATATGPPASNAGIKQQQPLSGRKVPGKDSSALASSLSKQKETNPVVPEGWRPWSAEEVKASTMTQQDLALSLASSRYDQTILPLHQPPPPSSTATEPESKEAPQFSLSSSSSNNQPPTTAEKVTISNDVTLTQHPFPSSEHLRPFDGAAYQAQQRAELLAAAEARLAQEREQERERKLAESEAARVEMINSLPEHLQTPATPAVPLWQVERSPRAPLTGRQHPLPPPGVEDSVAPQLNPIIDPFIPMQQLSARLKEKITEPPQPQEKLSREKQEEIFRVYQTILLQWCYLNAKQQASFETQQNKAFQDMHSVLQAIQQLRRELSSKLVQKQRKDHLLKLDQILNEQNKVYEIILPILQQFYDQYEQLHQAVEFARYRVGLNDVDVHVNEFGSTTSSALNVSSRQLARVNQLLAPHLQTFLELEQATAGLKSTLTSEVTELQTLYGLIQHACQYENMERGLRIEEIQKGKIERMKKQVILTQDQLQMRQVPRD